MNYIKINKGIKLLGFDLNFFKKAFNKSNKLNHCIELVENKVLNLYELMPIYFF